MNFRPELAAKVMAGEKTVTRRLMSDNIRSPWCVYGCSLRVGRSYAVCPGRGKHAIGRVTIVTVTDETLMRMAVGADREVEARREGFTTAEAFIEAWTRINGHWDPRVHVWRVEFEAQR
jgi:hypothetical protein